MRRAIIIALLACSAMAQDAGVWWGSLAAGQADWTPVQLGAKLAVWFDSSDNSTVLDASGNAATNGAPVQTWQDKSGNGRHATASAAAQRPSYRTSVQNGLAVLRTDGNDQMDIGSVGPVFRNKTAGYIIVVAKDSNQSGGDANHVLVAFWRNTSGSIRAGTYGSWTYGSAANGFWSAVGRRTDADSFAVAGISAGTGFNIVVTFCDWANGYVRGRLNSGPFVSTAYSSGSGNSSDTDSAGALIFWSSSGFTMPANSEIAELIVVNEFLMDSERMSVQNYLLTKWGVAP